MLTKKPKRAAVLEKANDVVRRLPIGFFLLGGLTAGAWALKLLIAQVWVRAALLGVTSVFFFAFGYWFTRSFDGGSVLRRSRGAATGFVAIVALAAIASSALWGGMQGNLSGGIDADGMSSTLLRVSFTFVDNASHEQDHWRLLAHAEGNYYVFDFAPGFQAEGRPIVYLIPDSAVHQARLTAP